MIWVTELRAAAKLKVGSCSSGPGCVRGLAPGLRWAERATPKNHKRKSDLRIAAVNDT